MPIVFEQPQPFAPNLVAAYGAAQQQARGGGGGANIGAVIGAYETAARLRQQSQSEGAQLAQRQTEANYENIQQSLIADSRRQQEEQELQFRKTAFAASQQPSARDLAMAQAEFQTRAGLAQIQSELQQQELSYTEQMRMQRMQMGLDSVMNNEKLSNEEKLHLATQIKSGLDPYKARQEAAQARMREQQASQFEQETTFQAQVQQKRAVFDASTMPQRTVRIPMPEGGFSTFLQTGFDQSGNPTYTQAKADKPEQTKPFDISKARKDAMAEAELAFPEDSVDEITGKPKLTAETLKKRNEYATKVFERERDASTQGTAGPAGQGAAAFQQQPSNVGGQQQAPQVEPQKPFVFDDPSTQSTAQKMIVKGNERAIADIQASNLPAKDKVLATRYADNMLILVQQYGSEQNMRLKSPEDYARFQEFKEKLRPMLAGIAPAQPQRPGPPNRLGAFPVPAGSRQSQGYVK